MNLLAIVLRASVAMPIELAHLVRRDPSRCPWTRQIFQSLFATQVLQRGPLLIPPALPPQADRIQLHFHFSGDPTVILYAVSCQHNPAS